MISTDKSVGAINAVFLGEGKFNVDRAGSTAINLTMVYTSSKRNDTYGSCAVTDGLLSAKTVEAFKEFVRLAEADFGSIVFDNMLIEPASTTSPEQDTGLPKGLGGL